MGNNALLGGLAGAATIILLQRRRRRRTRSEDGSSVSRQDSFSTTATAAEGSGNEDRPGQALGADQLTPISETLPEDSRQGGFPWELLILLMLLTGCLLAGWLRQAWDIVAVLAVCVSGIITRLVLKAVKRRKHARQSALALRDTSPHGSGSGGVLQAAVNAHHAPDLKLTGIWLKDSKASDPMDTVCDIMHLNGLIRVAIGLVRGMDISVRPIGADSSVNGTLVDGAATPTSNRTAGTAADAADSSHVQYVYDMAVFSVVKWFKVREKYVLNGPSEQFARRDMRKGKHTAHAVVLPDGGIRLEVEWGAPHTGRGYDELRLVGPDELHVTSHVDVSGRKHTYTQVYHRKRTEQA